MLFPFQRLFHKLLNLLSLLIVLRLTRGRPAKLIYEVPKLLFRLTLRQFGGRVTH